MIRMKAVTVLDSSAVSQGRIADKIRVCARS